MMNEFSLRIEPPRIIETNLDCTKKERLCSAIAQMENHLGQRIATPMRDLDLIFTYVHT